MLRKKEMKKIENVYGHKSSPRQADDAKQAVYSATERKMPQGSLKKKAKSAGKI